MRLDLVCWRLSFHFWSPVWPPRFQVIILFYLVFHFLRSMTEWMNVNCKPRGMHRQCNFLSAVSVYFSIEMFRCCCCCCSLRLTLKCITLPSRPRHPRIFFAAFRVTFLMPRVCFKSITWYIKMHHVKTFFLCGVVTFSCYVMFIQNLFIFKRNAYRGFCLP